MKKIASFLILLTGLLDGEIDVPKGVYLSSQLAEAHEKALKEKKPLVYILANPDVAGGPGKAVAEAALNDFRKKAVTVMLMTKDRKDDNMVSPLIIGTLNLPEMGATVPKMIGISPANDRLWGRMQYEELTSEQSRKSMLKDLLAIAKGKKEQPPKHDFALRWNYKGKPGFGVFGKFQKLQGGRVHLKDGEGKSVKIPIKSLCAPAAAYARTLAGKSDEGDNSKQDSGPVALVEEEWTNSKGVKIKATFVSLKGEQITLKLSNGKKSTFALNLLSEESQTRAKSYAE